MFQLREQKILLVRRYNHNSLKHSNFLPEDRISKQIRLSWQILNEGSHLLISAYQHSTYKGHRTWPGSCFLSVLCWAHVWRTCIVACFYRHACLAKYFNAYSKRFSAFPVKTYSAASCRRTSDRIHEKHIMD